MSLYLKKSDIKIDPKKIVLKKKGKDNTKSLRYHFFYDKIQISPWHDIPLISNKKKIYLILFVKFQNIQEKNLRLIQKINLIQLNKI